MTSDWYYEPADPEVGTAEGAWVHENCPNDNGLYPVEGSDGRCECCGAPAPTTAEPDYERDDDLDPSEYPRYYRADV